MVSIIQVSLFYRVFLGISSLSRKKHLKARPEPPEAALLKEGLHEIQRRSGGLDLQTPDEFVITSYDVIVHRDRKLGQGGYATVYEGDWKGTKVAIKEMTKGLQPEASRTRAFGKTLRPSMRKSLTSAALGAGYPAGG